MENRKAYQQAKKKVEARVGLYIHFSVYIAVSLLLITINLNTSPQNLWFRFPVIAMGIGVLINAASNYASPKFSEYKKVMVEKEMSKTRSIKY